MCHNEFDIVPAICSRCGSIDTRILDFFYPEESDIDQRAGYQSECNACEHWWDTYYD